MTFLRPLAVLALSIALLGGGQGAWAQAQPGTQPAVGPVAPERDRLRMNQRVFDAVWREVRDDYYDPDTNGVDWRAARSRFRPMAEAAQSDAELYRVLDQMLDMLDDRHAAAASPAAVQRRNAQRTRRPVIGVTLSRQDNGDYLIERVRPGSAAAEAGVMVGWRLPFDPDGWSPDFDVVVGEPVRVTLLDETGRAHDLTLEPRIMDPVPAFSADRSRPGVLVLRVDGFEQGLGIWMGEQLTGLAPETDVVLDLRGNPGGRLAEAEALLGCFLPGQQTWAARTDRSGRRTALRTDTPCGALRDPVGNDVVVLVDAASRSAAELTPAALQEAGRAVVIGQRTGGSVLISTETTLPDGGVLTLSRADFVTHGGVRLEKIGVMPDLEVETTLDDRRSGRDPVMVVALAVLEPQDETAQSRVPSPISP